MNETLKDMVGIERYPGIWKYWLIQKKRESKEERNKKYKKTINDGMLRNQKYVHLESHKTSGCPPEECGVLALFDISY